MFICIIWRTPDLPDRAHQVLEILVFIQEFKGLFLVNGLFGKMIGCLQHGGDVARI